MERQGWRKGEHGWLLTHCELPLAVRAVEVVLQPEGALRDDHIRRELRRDVRGCQVTVLLAGEVARIQHTDIVDVEQHHARPKDVPRAEEAQLHTIHLNLLAEVQRLDALQASVQFLFGVQTITTSLPGHADVILKEHPHHRDRGVCGKNLPAESFHLFR